MKAVLRQFGACDHGAFSKLSEPPSTSYNTETMHLTTPAWHADQPPSGLPNPACPSWRLSSTPKATFTRHTVGGNPHVSGVAFGYSDRRRRRWAPLALLPLLCFF